MVNLVKFNQHKDHMLNMEKDCMPNYITFEDKIIKLLIKSKKCFIYTSNSNRKS